jgi:Protein of unknown function (DUF2806)
MSEGISLIDIGDWSKTATVLVEKICDAIGGIAKPFQIKRVAKAEVAADIIHAEGQIEIQEKQRRAMTRFVAEEAKKQENIENITRKALPLVDDASNPQDVEDDWIVNFFDKCRIVSDDDMQNLWAKVLAGEANSPGSFSRRTVSFLGSLEKKEAIHFTNLCAFCVKIVDINPLIFNSTLPVYKDNGIDAEILMHLDDIGLIKFSNIARFGEDIDGGPATVSYFSTVFEIDVRSRQPMFDIGQVIFTSSGRQLFPVCGAEPNGSFFTYLLKTWSEWGLKPTPPYPN